MIKNNAQKKRAGRIVSESSMSYASKPICKAEECIGKMTVTNREGASEHGKEQKEKSTNKTRSSMKLGKKSVCRDKECIGET
jgi:hypothetical protein